MSRHSAPQLKLALPQVHGACRVKLGLGVNQQTGRVQWCPGLTCCKLLLLLPVVMLPLTLVLLLLLRLDGMLHALHLNEQRMRERERDQAATAAQSAASMTGYMSDFESLLPESSGYNELINDEFLLPQTKKPQAQSDADLAAARERRCLPYRYGNGETLDLEERSILMMDARTSFLPHGTGVVQVPRECFDNRIKEQSNAVVEEDSEVDIDMAHRKDVPKRYPETVPYWRRGRRNAEQQQRHKREEQQQQGEEEEHQQSIPDADASLADDSSLPSFWSGHGTRDDIRQAQAKTMKRYMNTKVDPCVDFYKYACGNWEKLHPIPKDKAGFDTFEMLRESLDVVLRNLLEQNVPIATPETRVQNTIMHLNEEKQQPETEQAAELVAEELRQHIVRRRQLLNRVLVRYKRFTNGTKRKRLIEPARDKSSKEVAEVAGIIAPSTMDKDKDKVNSNININNGNNNNNNNSNNKQQQQLTQPVTKEFLKPHYDAVIKAKNLYKSCVNSNLLTRRGLEPLQALIQQLGGWPVLDPSWQGSQFNWQQLAATLRRYNNDILIVQWVGADIKNSEENIMQFDQTGLGLPTREYFLQQNNAKYLHAYQRYMAEVMQKLGASKADAQHTASELIGFETRLAAITAPAEQRLNVTKLYKRMTLQQLRETVPEIGWTAYLSTLQGRNVSESEQVVIYAVDYMKQLVTLLASTEPRTIANYMMWRFVRHRINNLDDRFDDIKQSFYHSLFGREESPQRWKVCIAQVNTNMGMAVGSMFVSRYFDDNSKRDTLRMTHELQQAFRDILKKTDWLDASTKQLAEAKVNAMSLKIGYPDFILNPEELNEKYAGIEIDPDKYFENTLNVLLHTAKTEQAKLHERVNKTNWQTAPAIVNAYYSRNKNQIMFPAGILQPPFYHRHFPKSLNFGGIGVVIGHELTHGFDDKGRLFDSNGNIHKWWTDASIRGFDERARCIISQYGNYTVEEVGILLNGESTQGENIADNGGLRQAFHAYMRWLTDHPLEAREETLPGLNMTGPQLFFLNFGQVWCGAMRPEAIRNKLNTAIHSPGRYRVIGTLSNSHDFAREFSCAAGTPMNPIKKCSVW